MSTLAKHDGVQFYLNMFGTFLNTRLKISNRLQFNSRSCSTLVQMCPLEVLFCLLYFPCQAFIAVRRYWRKLIRTDQQRILFLFAQKYSKNRMTEEADNEFFYKHLPPLHPLILMLRYRFRPFHFTKYFAYWNKGTYCSVIYVQKFEF